MHEALQALLVSHVLLKVLPKVQIDSHRQYQAIAYWEVGHCSHATMAISLK
jgi:hypothetical protein